MSHRVLIVEDDVAIRFGVRRHLERHGFVVAEAPSCTAARERFIEFDPHAVVIDFRLPDGDALDLIGAFRHDKRSVAIIVVSGYATIDLAVRAIKLGADNVLAKPIDLDRLVEELKRACTHASPAPGESGKHRIPRTLGWSPRMFALRDDLDRVRHSDCSLLVIGETGTGKTMLVRALHEASHRADKPFVDLNCAGLARDLVESELFGHDRGAFTSAHAAKPGMFELADGGTLFLDEIGDIDIAVQPKVLKAIEEKRFRRLGSTRERNVDVRIVAATHRDLRDAVRMNQFRSDLYYRLSTVTITIPPLRDRVADIPFLARELLHSMAARIGRVAPTLSLDAEAALVAYAWPGNIRELRNVLERALHFTQSDVVSAQDLRMDEPSPRSSPALSTLRAVEREHIERAIAAHGHVAEAARSLGISRSSMYLKLKEYGIIPSRGSSPRLKTGGGLGS